MKKQIKFAVNELIKNGFFDNSVRDFATKILEEHLIEKDSFKPTINDRIKDISETYPSLKCFVYDDRYGVRLGYSSIEVAINLYSKD